MTLSHLNTPAKLDRKKNGSDDELDMFEHSLNEMQVNLKSTYQLMETEIIRRKETETVLIESEKKLRTFIMEISTLLFYVNCLNEKKCISGII